MSPLAKLCATCARLVPPGHTYCRDCDANHNRDRNQRPKHKAIWNTTRWRATRATRLNMDGHACTHCGTTQRLSVHHLDAAAYADPFNPDGCITLCTTCHGGTRP